MRTQRQAIRITTSPRQRVRDTIDTIVALTMITCEHIHAGIKAVTATIRTVTQKATGHHH